MLTRLEVSNFKNMVGVDVRFGPFTCIAGANGVGKSNLFDAIRFLSTLADSPLINAVMSMRDEGSRSSDIRTLFHKVGEKYADTMHFSAEMIIPQDGVDDLGQLAKATISFVRYELDIKYRPADLLNPIGSLEITKEVLRPMIIGEARKNLAFPHTPAFFKSAVVGRRSNGVPFISTKEEDGQCIIQLHQDGGSSGKPQKRRAAQLPRTIISVTNATEHPTALLVRREMQSWQMLQMEPTALRRPDELNAPSRLEANGAHLPATLYRLAHQEALQHPQYSRPDQLPLEQLGSKARIFSQIARRLNELIEDVREILIDRDDKRQMLVLKVKLKDGTELPARSLSDGTLRFLALAVIEQDTEARGLLCMEEPENGIHPARIAAMLRLLNDIACDTNYAIGPDNPLRQVIINTHAPAVVQEVPDDSLILADTVVMHQPPSSGAASYRLLSLSCLADTWRGPMGMAILSRGKLLRYLNPVSELEEEPAALPKTRLTAVRVIDRADIQQLKLSL